MSATFTFEGIIHDLPEAEYHASEALSSTQVKWLVESPGHYRWNKDHPQEHKPAFDLGSAVHTKVLGTGWTVAEIPFDNWMTKPAREARDQAYAAGLIPMLSKDLTVVNDMAEAVLRNEDAARLFERGRPEVSVFANEPITGIDMRCRFDWLRDDVAVDLKTSANDATPTGFGKAAWNYGYGISRAHYLDTYELVTGVRLEMLFVVVEKTGPYRVGVFRLSNDQIEMGERRARIARAQLAFAREHDLWPTGTNGVKVTTTPMGEIYEFQDKYGVNA